VIGVIMTSPDGYNNSIHDTFSPETGEQQGGIEQRDPDTLASPRTSFLGQFNPNNQFGNPGGRPGGGGNIPGGGGSTNGGAAGGVWIDPIVRLANEADERTPLMRSAALRSLPSERNRFSD
jgi:hypothetical protein